MILFIKFGANIQKQTNKTLNNLENKITRAHCHKLDHVNKHTQKQKREKYIMFLNLGAEK
jgi:hypothetical protein